MSSFVAKEVSGYGFSLLIEETQDVLSANGSDGCRRKWIDVDGPRARPDAGRVCSSAPATSVLTERTGDYGGNVQSSGVGVDSPDSREPIVLLWLLCYPHMR